MSGALTRSFWAAATSIPQQVGTASTWNSTKNSCEGAGMEGGQGLRIEGDEGDGTMDVGAEDWAEQLADKIIDGWRACRALISRPAQQPP